MSLNDKVIKKLEEYGIEISHSYRTDDDADVLYTEEMIIFIDENEKDIAVSFDIVTRPNIVCKLSLILREVSECTISVMEDYTYTEDGKFLTGEEAEKYEDSLYDNEAIKQSVYNEILMNSDCSEC